MLYIVLLISQVSCEWVEISQNYHRINSFHKSGESEVNIYPNSTITEIQWNKGVIERIGNVGNIKKVPIVSVKSPSILERQRINVDPQKSLNTATLKHEPNTINPLISGTFTSSPRNELNRLVTNKNHLEDNIKNLKNTTNINKINLEGDNSHEIITGDEETRKWIYVRTEAPKIANQNSPKSIIDLQNVPHNADHFEIKHRNNEKIVYDNGEISNTNKYSNRNSEAQDISEQTKSSTSEDINKVFDPVTNKIEEGNNNKILKLNPSIVLDQSKFSNDIANKDRSRFINNDVPKRKTNNKINASDSNSLDRMLKMVKNIVDTISKNTKLGFNGKINYLEDLKNTILATIEERIDRAWPDDMGPQSPRTSRSTRWRAPRQARGHVEFPSSESALMTISFLTFAVFLIKLVLQVIHAYKSKAMMVTPAVVAAVGRAAARIKNKT